MEVLARTIRQQKEIKGILIGMEEMKLSPFAEDMIFCIENPNDSTKKVRTNKFNKVAGYNVNI